MKTIVDASEKHHKKPTQAFGYINFSKAGKVSKHIFKLPDEKEKQEEIIAKKFIESLNKKEEKNVILKKILPQADNDVLLEDSFGEIELEIAELTNYEYAIPLVAGEYITKPISKKIKLLKQVVPHTTDEDQYRLALVELIKRKAERHYSKIKKRRLWLLVFSLSLYLTEYWQQGKKVESEGLKLARNYLFSINHPFDEVWFYYPDINPIKIYSIA